MSTPNLCGALRTVNDFIYVFLRFQHRGARRSRNTETGSDHERQCGTVVETSTVRRRCENKRIHFGAKEKGRFGLVGGRVPDDLLYFVHGININDIIILFFVIDSFRARVGNAEKKKIRFFLTQLPESFKDGTVILRI